MSDEIQVGATFHKKRVGKHIAMVEGPPPTAPERPKGRLPRITRYMALAIYYEDLIRQGHVHGASDNLGGEPERDGVTVADFAATVYHQLGIDPAKRLMAPGDRPTSLVKDGRVLQEILA